MVLRRGINLGALALWEPNDQRHRAALRGTPNDRHEP
jgi:hypothetical protein